MDLTSAGRKPAGTRLALAWGIAAAVLFAAAASLRLGLPGMQYDELHQAVGAFAWRGRPTPFFVSATAFGLPVLNMSYSGAIKSAVYGLYLRLSGHPFTPVSWRAVGIGCVALGLLSLCVLGRRSPRLLLGALVALLLSDPSVLLLSRYDGGPTALGLLLRLLLAGVWLRAAAQEAPARWHALALGLLTGVSAFEKLSAAVLVIPLAILVLGDARFRERALLRWCAGGFVAGVLPLAALNARSWSTSRSLISLRHATGPVLPSAVHLDKAWGYLSLAAGRDAAWFSLGTRVPLACAAIEGLALGAALVGCAWLGRRLGDPRPARLVACWLGVGLGLALLPSEEVWFHHWIVGTPFQYLAIALCAARLGSGPARARSSEVALQAVLAILLVNRLVVMSAVLGWLAEGRTARDFDPELNQLGRFAARQERDVTFVAATWGVATQIYCFSDGREGVVTEPFWSYAGPADLERAVDGRRVLYVVSTSPLSAVSPEESRRILADAATLAGWTAVPAEPELRGLRTLSAAKYVRAP